MTGHDVAMMLLELDGLRLRSTEERGTTLLHRMSRPGGADLLIGGPLDPDDVSHEYWLGADVGTYPADATVLDALLAAEDARFVGFDKLRGALLRDGTGTVWWTETFRPDDLSLAGTRTLTARADEGARRVRDILDSRGSAPTQADRDSLEVAERAGDHALRAGGHGRWTFRAERFVGRYRWADEADLWDERPFVRVTGTVVQVGESDWPIPASITGENAVMWLEGRWPPDCIRLGTSEGKVVAAGGLGVVAFALEDRSDFARGFERVLGIRKEPTFLDVVLDALGTYSKLEHLIRPAMPKGPFGWQRPFTIVASTIRREARVRVLVPERGELEDDGALSVAMTDLVRADGRGSEKVLDRFRDRFTVLEHALTHVPGSR